MRQIAGIVGHLTSLNLVAAENIDSWVDNPEIQIVGKQLGNGSVLLYRQRYDAVIIIERWPHKTLPAELLFAQLAAWLIENDGDDVRSDNSEAVIKPEVDVLDDETADIVITIDFIEDVTIRQSAAGTIVYDGGTYALDDPDILYAEEGDLIAEVES